ncbi:MAG: hypothetical protein WC446_02735 [Candidatus Paceibacterota bacterium]|nr:hypothetical protein [Tissierellia bacterium]
MIRNINFIYFCTLTILLCSCSKFHQSSKYYFDETGISRENLESYLHRSVTMSEFLTFDPYCNDGFYPDKERDVKLIQNVGAKFIGRAIYRWGGESVFNTPDFLDKAKKLTTLVHETDPDVVFQAAIFEAVSTEVNSIGIPEWVFIEFNLPFEKRNFNYYEMLNSNGKYKDFWGEGISVPDISKTETKLWFLFLAGTYLKIGCEALHLGQIALIGMEDNNFKHWGELLDMIRSYARKNARRKWVLLDAHTPFGGMVINGKSLLDFNSFPLRIKEIPEKPQKSVLEMGYLDSFYGRSKGGITPSGWECESLPYLVEFDNFGVSETPGEATIDSHYVWGYDEITWFCLQDEAYRNEWLKYAYDWIRENDSNGFLQMPVCRIMLTGKDSLVRKCHSNTRTADFPQGLNLEETIKEIWLQ